MIWGGELLVRDGVAAGQAMSGSWGATIGAGVGLAWVNAPDGRGCRRGVRPRWRLRARRRRPPRTGDGCRSSRSMIRRGTRSGRHVRTQQGGVGMTRSTAIRSSSPSSSSRVKIERRRDRHRHRRVHRHAGPAAGQAAARPVLRRPRHRARHRGLQLPAERRRRHEHRRRLRDVLVGEGLRRHGVRPRLRHHPPARPPAGNRDDPVRPGVARPQARRPVAAHDPQGPARQGGRRRIHGARRHRARVHRVQHDIRTGVGEQLPDHVAGEPVQRRLLDRRARLGSSRCCARSATRCTPPA